MRKPKPTPAKVGARMVQARIAATEETRRAAEHALAAGRLACEEWNLRMVGVGGPAEPSPTVGQALAAGYPYLEIRCKRCATHALIHLGAVAEGRRSPDMEIWRLEDLLRCRHCSYERRLPAPRGAPRWRPPAGLVRLRRRRSLEFEPWYPEEPPSGR